MDANGKVVIRLDYEDIRAFRAGSFVVPVEYDAFIGFNEGLLMLNKGGKRGALDEDGNVVIPFEYDGHNVFINGVAGFIKDG